MADKKDGMSVKEIENFARKYTYEVFFSLVFILASFFSMVMFGVTWCIYLACLGGILGVWFPVKVEKAIRSIFLFVNKQQKPTMLVLGVVGLIVAIFLPPLVFFVLGLMGGKGLYRFAMHSGNTTR
ncbi:MAG: hypothetical protein KDK50_06260 [Chlamydiia bacterium]|nr:hypothetical protein [Chlamydiia bacterium]MCP5492261.1 hypothetical protein [Chlamydiales bacterium]